MSREERAFVRTRLALGGVVVLFLIQAIWHPVPLVGWWWPLGTPPANLKPTVMDLIHVQVNRGTEWAVGATVHIYLDKDPERHEMKVIEPGNQLDYQATPGHLYTFVADDGKDHLSPGVDRDLTHRDQEWGKLIPRVTLELPQQ